MILRKIRLRNIRSYINETIDFSVGTLLLSGDIGSGKSTILFSIEFALFGLMRGVFSGESLLRTGTGEGEVELTFSIGKHTHTIKRTLKRQRGGVQQSSGYIISDGEKKEGTAVELKAEILNILGYPKDLLSKSKGLVYRYTVYTPQEEMKQIIVEDKESRLDILRKVFGIEKYKTIQDNCAIYIRAIKERIREFEGMITDLEEKKKQKREYDDTLQEIEQKLKKVLPEYNIKSKVLEERKNATEKIEKEKDMLTQLQKKSLLIDSELKNHLERHTSNIEEIRSISLQLKNLEKDAGEKTRPIQDIKEGLVKGQQDYHTIEKDIISAEKRIASLQANLHQSNSIKETIKKMDSCPTCEQTVGEEHKNKIDQREDKKIGEINSEVKNCQEKAEMKKEQQAYLKKEIENYQTELSIAQLNLEKQKMLDEKSNRLALLKEQNDTMKKSIGRINTEKMSLKQKIRDFADIEARFSKNKSALEADQQAFHSLDKNMSVLREKKSGIKKMIDLVEQDINAKELTKKNLSRTQDIHSWLQVSFLTLMSTMERAVMRIIHAEFTSVFQQWFDVLIDDDNIQVRLDEEFVPIIDQNGYEINVASLSGGERTSCALAYRLALNKVINDMIDSIRTKDIIILDEPTDGFSTEQLDRMRDLLELIHIRQIVIVSHETKIESFVENIIRIVKTDHVSRAVV